MGLRSGMRIETTGVRKQTSRIQDKHDPLIHGFVGIGPPSTFDMEDKNLSDIELDDTELVRLEPAQSFGTSYTFSVLPKLKGLRMSDVYNLAVGHTYDITLRPQKWWWKSEDEMPSDCSVQERREILKEQQRSQWTPDCTAPFEVRE